MRAILADNNIQGHVRALAYVLESKEWREIWASFGLPILTFRQLGLPPDVPDATLWQIC